MAKSNLARIEKQYPVWFGIVGVEKKFATFFGIDHYLQDNGLTSAPVAAFQKIKGEWIEVKHQCTGMIYTL